MHGWHDEYDNIGYIGKIADYNLVSVLIQNFDIDSDDVNTILGSIKIV